MYQQMISEPMATPAMDAPHAGRAMASAPQHADVDTLLERFAPIQLDEMNGVALLDRIDTKYVLDLPRLREMLPHLAADYRVLDIDHVRLNAYQTLYFDTADFALYQRHHAGAANRCKVRSRHYLNTHRSFFEVKIKTNHDRTVKHRVETAAFVDDVTGMTGNEIHDIIPAFYGALEPKVWNDFYRVTLVGTTRPERVTLDFGLRVANTEREIMLPNLVVAEVKQARADCTSPFVQLMRGARLRPTSISKYCVGVALLHPHIKHNNFKTKLRAIAAITEGTLS